MHKLKTRKCDDKSRTRINEKFEGLTRLPRCACTEVRSSFFGGGKGAYHDGKYKLPSRHKSRSESLVERTNTEMITGPVVSGGGIEAP